MKKSLASLSLITAFASAILLFTVGCGDAATGREYRTLEYFATQSIIVIYDDFGAQENREKYDGCIKEIEDTLKSIEKSISVSVADSFVSVFNDAAAGSKVKLNETTYGIMRTAQEMFNATGGTYDPAAGLLVDLWGFSPRFDDKHYKPTKKYDRPDPQAQLPDEKYIEAFKKLTGFGQVGLYEISGEYFAEKPDITASVEGDSETYSMQIDLGGIGKGYAADKSAGIIKRYGYEYGYVSIGNSSLSLLKDYKGAKAPDWAVGVASPGGGIYAELYARDACISTSGQYYRYYETGGDRYSHIIDCSTGRPIGGGIESITILTSSAAQGDALSTALCVMGDDGAYGYMSENDITGMYICPSDGGSYIVKTNLEKNKYKITDGVYRVA